MGVSPWDNMLCTFMTLVWTLTFDLYVGGGGIFSEFYSQFLSCSLMIEKIVHKHFVLGNDFVLPSHMHHRNGNSSKRFVSLQILLESLASGPNHWGPDFSKDNSFIVKIHWQFFKFSPANSLGQFQLNLNQSILGQGGFKLVETKGHILFQLEMIAT